MASGNSKVDWEAADGIHSHGLDIKNREIYLFGEDQYIRVLEDDEPGVEYVMANRFIKNMQILRRTGTGRILIHMKTNGGHWHEGMAIYDAIKACEDEVWILNYTHARSMSSIIFCAADYRVMMPHSNFMFHDGTMSFDGTVKQWFTETKELERACEEMMRIYVERLRDCTHFEGRTDNAIKKWLRAQMDKKEEVYLDPEQAVEYNFADAIFHSWDELKMR